MNFSVTIATTTISSYQTFVSGAVVAFLPLITAVIGIFVAFAIANQLQFFIKKIMK